MKYQTKATPITTEAEFDAAKAAGARIEYTAFGPGGLGVPEDHYGMPTHDRSGSGGWIPHHEWMPLRGGELWRAFYPTAFTEAK